MKFSKWLAAQAARPDAVGELARRSVRHDPLPDDLNASIRRLQNRKNFGMGEGAHWALVRAYREFLEGQWQTQNHQRVSAGGL